MLVSSVADVADAEESRRRRNGSEEICRTVYRAGYVGISSRRSVRTLALAVLGPSLRPAAEKTKE